LFSRTSASARVENSSSALTTKAANRCRCNVASRTLLTF
jgi:hypothetical protein